MNWIRLLDYAAIRADVVAGLTVGVMVIPQEHLFSRPPTHFSHMSRPTFPISHLLFFIPQSMSYANIAGLDYKYGMYSALVPLMVYAFMGTSRQLAVGPVAMISLLVEVGLKDQLTDEECPGWANRVDKNLQQYDICPTAYAELAFLTSFLVGVLQIAAGMLRLGFLVSFLAHPVVSGFTSGAAIIIGLSQVQYFLDYKIAKSQYVYETLEYIFQDIHKANYVTILLGLGWWFMLWLSRKAAAKNKKLSWLRPCSPLMVCVLGIFISANWSYFGGCNFEVCPEAKGDPDAYLTASLLANATNGTAANVTIPNDSAARVVGGIEGGFPSFSGSFDFSKIGRVMNTAISATVIGYMESISIAKSLAAKHQYEINPGQELFALGFANLAGSFLSCYPVTGSFSRSAVNNMVGAKTNLSGLITSLLMLLTLLVLTDYFYFLPKYCLAAIVISSVTNLVDITEAKYLWRVKRTDFFLWVGAFLGTLFLGVQLGILLAVGGSLIVVIYESVRPQMVVLWRLPGTPIYRNIKQDSVGHFVPGVLCVRVGSSMYFANVAYIRDKLRELTNTFFVDKGANSEPPQPVRYIVVECTAVISIDSAALHMLESLQREFQERGIYVCFACVGNRVEKVIRVAGLYEQIGGRWFHPSVHAAVSYCIRHRILRSNMVGDENSAEADELTALGGTPPQLIEGESARDEGGTRSASEDTEGGDTLEQPENAGEIATMHGDGRTSSARTSSTLRI